MIEFQSEYARDYSSYTFGYARYAVLVKEDKLSGIYRAGYLPYTGDPSIEREIFYMARSLRIDLGFYQTTSENRRVDRKMHPLEIEMTIRQKPPLSKLPDDHFKLAVRYARERFKGGEMTRERFEYVYTRAAATHLVEFKSRTENGGGRTYPDKAGGELVGFVLAGMDEEMLHYWFAFFRTRWMNKVPLGKWMMWKCVDRAAREGKEYAYLGTCYGRRSLYKVRDFKGAQWFDGALWSDDVDALKARCKDEVVFEATDAFKQMDDRNAYIEKLLETRGPQE